MGGGYFYVSPVVTVRMLVRKERSRGSAHAEVFWCWRKVWVVLVPPHWSADRRGWQHTAPCSGATASSGAGVPSPGQDPALRCLQDARLTALAARRRWHPSFAPGVEWAVTGGSGGGGWTILHPVPNRMTPAPTQGCHEQECAQSPGRRVCSGREKGCRVSGSCLLWLGNAAEREGALADASRRL